MTLGRATWTLAALLSLGGAGCGNILGLDDLHDRSADASGDAPSTDGTTDVTATEASPDAGGDVAAEGGGDATTDAGGDGAMDASADGGDATMGAGADGASDATSDVIADVVGDVAAEAEAAAGGACDAGATCVPANPCDNGSLVCTSGTPTCMDLGTPNTAVTGTTCGTNMVCNDGTCSACTTAAMCTPTNACHVGSTTCTTGVSVCMDTGNDAMNGTSCGVSQVCFDGTCAMCVQGQACPPTANPCHNGSLDCTTGTPTCNDLGTANTGANGTTCGTNMVCDDGTCSPCTSGSSCTPTNVCDLGATSCTTGVSVCADTGNANSSANGTTCATGKICSAGACDTPAVLTLSPTPWNFGSVAAGSTSAVETFTVTNTGQAPSGTLTTGLSGSTPAQFVITSNTCTGTLAGGGTCSIKVEFSPNLAGPYSATLTASATPGGAPTSALAGTSGAPCGELTSDANTVALWHFDEGSGLTTADASGNGHTGTLGDSTTANSADPSWVTGRFGKALFYASANSQYVQGAGSNTFPSNQVTVEFWVNAVSPYGSSGTTSQPFTAGFIDVAVEISTSDILFGVGNGNNWSFQSETTSTLGSGSWHYYAFTYDTVNQWFYVDGTLLGAVSTSPAITLQSTGAYGYQIGGRPANTFLNGTLDEMRLSNTARTTGQIQNYYLSASTCP
jgi:hypothetical protein